MIITLIATGLLLLGLIWLTLCKIVENKYYKEKTIYSEMLGFRFNSETVDEREAYITKINKQEKIRDRWSKLDDILNEDESRFFGAFCTVLGSVCSFIVIWCIIGTHYKLDVQHEINSFNYERQVIEYRLEESDLEGNELLYRDIVDYNQKVRDLKHYNENPFTNWFVSNDLANSIDYVEYKK